MVNSAPSAPETWLVGDIGATHARFGLVSPDAKLLHSRTLSDEDYRAEITTTDAPASMRAGERKTLRFRIRNLGRSTWPAHGDSHGMYQVNAGDRWLDAAGGRIVNDLDGRRSLPEDLGPGEEVELPLDVTAPRAPGEYVLEIDMIHEGVTFFYEKGSRTLRMRVRVEP